MTASNCTPGGGHESGDRIEPESSAFERWARREIATTLRVQPGRVQEAATAIAEAVEAGEPVDPEDAVELRKQARELLRVADGVTVGSEPAEGVDFEALAGRVHEAGHEVQQASIHLDQVLLNEGVVTPRDVERVRGEVERLERAVVEAARFCPGDDR